METNITTTEPDAEVIAAIKNGDRERYRELIERHEQRVYAVAWCRLGDADLAEEATQEAFIKGFRHLDFLGHGNKFAVWITAIARNTAINLGLRRRNELKKRERWAVEQAEPDFCVAGDEAEEGGISKQTLRETLAELPPVHRECLVLFYLEGKSVEEGAALLGISQNTFKVRLHRARGVMRDRLENRLEESLSGLRPRHALAPAIMGFLAARPAEAAAATGGLGIMAKASGFALKALPFPFAVYGMWLLGFLPGALLSLWISNLEQQNFREKEGFRARLHKSVSRRSIIFFSLLMLGFYTASPMLTKAWGPGTFARIAGIFFLPATLLQLRRLRINRSKFFVSLVASTSIANVWLLSQGFGFPINGNLFVIFAMLLGYRSLRYQPSKRMDYNLFLRQSQGVIPDGQVGYESDRSFTKPELFAFGRFLGERWLICDYRNLRQGLEFRMTNVEGISFLPIIRFGFWWRVSRLSVLCNGEVHARIGPKDELALAGAVGLSALRRSEMEANVAQAVRAALHSFTRGDLPEAERFLGEVPEKTIFKELPQLFRANRLQKAVMLGVAIGAIILMFATQSVIRSLHTPTSNSHKQQLKLALKKLENAKTEQTRVYALGDAAKESFTLGHIEDARKYATELLNLAPKVSSNGNAVHDGNIILGRIAVKENRIADAKRHLLGAGQTSGAPNLDTFGPNMALAEELLKRGERQTVLEYFQLCRRFWTLHPEKLDQWTKEVEAGRAPALGANLFY